ncbi:hypothetical protein HK101_003389 [Irineochytrium annulatum]|nr:hypothetical protein HK101_003389 [Irineochytrium annulatum]
MSSTSVPGLAGTSEGAAPNGDAAAAAEIVRQAFKKQLEQIQLQAIFGRANAQMVTVPTPAVGGAHDSACSKNPANAFGAAAAYYIPPTASAYLPGAVGSAGAPMVGTAAAAGAHDSAAPFREVGPAFAHTLPTSTSLSALPKVSSKPSIPASWPPRSAPSELMVGHGGGTVVSRKGIATLYRDFLHNHHQRLGTVMVEAASYEICRAEDHIKKFERMPNTGRNKARCYDLFYVMMGAGRSAKVASADDLLQRIGFDASHKTYGRRLHKWIKINHIDAFFEYLSGIPNAALAGPLVVERLANVPPVAAASLDDQDADGQQPSLSAALADRSSTASPTPVAAEDARDNRKPTELPASVDAAEPPVGQEGFIDDERRTAGVAESHAVGRSTHHPCDSPPDDDAAVTIEPRAVISTSLASRRSRRTKAGHALVPPAHVAHASPSRDSVSDLSISTANGAQSTRDVKRAARQPITQDEPMEPSPPADAATLAMDASSVISVDGSWPSSVASPGSCLQLVRADSATPNAIKGRKRLVGEVEEDVFDLGNGVVVYSAKKRMRRVVDSMEMLQMLAFRNDPKDTRAGTRREGLAEEEKEAVETNKRLREEMERLQGLMRRRAFDGAAKER